MTNAVAISVSLFLIVMTSVVLGTGLPFALARAGVDPANAGTSIQVRRGTCGAGLSQRGRSGAIRRAAPPMGEGASPRKALPARTRRAVQALGPDAWLGTAWGTLISGFRCPKYPDCYRADTTITITASAPLRPRPRLCPTPPPPLLMPPGADGHPGRGHHLRHLQPGAGAAGAVRGGGGGGDRVGGWGRGQVGQRRGRQVVAGTAWRVWGSRQSRSGCGDER